MSSRMSSLADVFAAGELPHWADEGMAMQMPTPTDKALALHSRDLSEAIQERRVVHIGELLAEAGYPTGDARAVFYSESAAIVGYLVGRSTPADFVKFVHRGGQVGLATPSLARCMRFPTSASLDHLWTSRGELARR